MKRIGVLSSGGDAPGMNATLRAIVRTALYKGVAVTGFLAGYDGLINGDAIELDSTSVGGIINRGGTIIRSGRSEAFRTPEGRKKAAETAQAMGVEGLIVIGGDGSLTGALQLEQETGFPVIGAPGTIDNDLAGTDYTIGFDTAVNTALEAIDKIRDTAYSHDRVFVIEVMGRRKGFIALEVGIAGGAEAILLPDEPYDLYNICELLKIGELRGKRSSIIVTAEGAAKAETVSEKIGDITGNPARYLVLGHMQRGGSPTSFDRVLATRLGSFAVERLLAGHSAQMAGIRADDLVSEPIAEILAADKHPNPDKIRLAHLVGQ